MRILIDYRPALRQRSGVGEYIHGLARALLGMGLDDTLTLFTSSWKDRLDPAGLQGARIVDRRIPVGLLNAAWHRFDWPPVEALTGASHDVVHSPHPLLLPARRAAQVITIHDLDFLDHPERTEQEIRRDYARLAPLHAQRADHVVVNSAYTGGEVHQRLGVPLSRITVCRPGRPPWTPRTRAPEGGYVLFVGTLEARKNIPGLLDAYRRLLAEMPAAPDLLLAGRPSGAAAPWLARLAEPPLAGRARHLGYVSDARRRELYEGAALVVLPSFEEGFGLPVLEAMIVGVPVVASDRGALPEVLGDAGILVDPSDPGEMARAMRRLLTDPSLARALAARGVRRAGLFDWGDSARALRGAYEAAVASRRGRPART